MSRPGVFQRIRTIDGKHTDHLGHVNNVVWVELIVDLAQGHVESLGLDFETTRKLGGIWIVRRHEIDYHQPALPGDRVLEETWVRSARGARSVRHARFTRPVDGAVLVTALCEWAYVDARTLRPRRIDPQILEAYRIIDEKP